MLERIHHLTFVVRDLEASLARYEREFAVTGILRESLPGRGVLTGRFMIGETWMVLVQPVGPGVTADHLREHGEGLLLMSLQVASLDTAAQQLRSRGVDVLGAERRGLADWRIQDFNSNAVPGATLQLCEADPLASDY